MGSVIQVYMKLVLIDGVIVGAKQSPFFNADILEDVNAADDKLTIIPMD